jgi:very-short-patch-repair endonuclease
VVVHRRTSLAQRDVTRKNNIPVTRPARTALDIAEVATTREVERTLDETQRLRLCSEEQLRDVIARSPGRVGAAHLAAVLDDHALGTTATVNDFEELFFGLCREHGLPQPQVNVFVGPYKVDFLWRNARIIVETDGRETHFTRKAFEADRARDAELTTAGWHVLRFTWRQLTRQPEWVLNTLLKLLSRTTGA